MAHASRRSPRRRRHNVEPRLPLLHSTTLSLVRALITLSQEVIHGAKLSVCQRGNSAAIMRRVKILLMFFEDVRDVAVVLPPSAVLCFQELHGVIQEAKLLLDDCRERSRIWLLMEQESVAMEFHVLAQAMAKALDILPMPLLDVSCEVKEQVELVRRQARKAAIYVDPGEEQLRARVQAAMGKLELKETPEAAELGMLFGSLELQSERECRMEMERLEAEEVGGELEAERAIGGLVSFVRYCKCVLYGVPDEEEEEVEEEKGKKAEEEAAEAEMKMPEDFRCPISLELMRDPVIVATGQTYDRATITRWMEGGHWTCPNSGQKLAHRHIIPNYALRNLIQQWCLRHNVPLLPAEQLPPARTTSIGSTPAALEATKLTAEFLLRQLPTASPDIQRHIARELRLLSKSGSDNRKVIAAAGAIPLLVPLLSAADARTQEHAATALLNLAIYAPNKTLIHAAGAFDPLVVLLTSPSASDATRENSAAALFALSLTTDYAAVLGRHSDAISGLLQLLRTATPRGKRDAASALFNLAAYSPNRSTLVHAGAVPVLLEIISADRQPLMEETLAVLAVLARCPEGRSAIVCSSAIPLFANLLRVTSPKGKEYTLALLVSLCKHGENALVLGIMSSHSIFASLHCVLSTGTPRARRKAASLFRILHRSNAPANYFFQ